MIRKNKILDPVFLIEDGHQLSVLIPYIYNEKYGLSHIRPKPASDDKAIWTFKFKTIKGDNLIEIKPHINIVMGELQTPEKWLVPYTRCCTKQIDLIVRWIANLNKGLPNAYTTF